MVGYVDDGATRSQGGYARLNASFSAAFGCSQSNEASIRSANKVNRNIESTQYNYPITFKFVFANFPVFRKLDFLCPVPGVLYIPNRANNVQPMCTMRENMRQPPSSSSTNNPSRVPVSVSSVQLSIRRHRFWYSSRMSDRATEFVAAALPAAVLHMCLVNAPTMAASRLKAATLKWPFGSL